MFRRISGCLLLIGLAALVAPAPVAAQDGSAQGKVTDVQGKPIDGATVTYELVNSGRKFTTKSDKNGTYLQVGLVQGQYTLTVEKDGVGKISRMVMIRGARRNPYDIVLAPGTGDAPSAVDPKLVEANRIINEGV